MRVLLAHCFYRSSAPSGEDSVYNNEKLLLEANNIDVMPLEKQNDDINISSLTGKLKAALNTAWSRQSYTEVANMIKRNRPDIAHFHNTFPQLSPSVYKACHDNKVPVVQTLHNYRIICPGAMLLRDGKPCELCLDDIIFPLHSLKYKCYRNSISATSALALMITRNRLTGTYNNTVNSYIALTHFAKEKFISGGLPENKILVKPNFLSDTITPSFKNKNYAIFVGRLSDEKGIKTLLKSWLGVKNLQLKVLGDGNLREELEEFSKKNNINAQFLGFQSHKTVLHEVKNAMLQIIPSECYEGFPMSVLESFASGTPVIASRLGSLQEIIEDNKTGVLFEPANPAELLRKINALINNPTKRIMLASGAREVFEKKYSQKVNFKTLMNIYKTSIHNLERKL